jgi:protein-S-isoprenylcysteine O-methyltransferase Ste14
MKAYYDPIIFIPWLGLIAYWIYSARGNKRVASQISPTWTWMPALGLAAIVFLSRLYPAILTYLVFPPTQFTESIGVILCTSGVALAIWSRRILGKNWSDNPMIKEGHELISVGPYRYVRHPIYSGILLGLLGVGIGEGQIQHLLIFALALVVLWLKLRIEESLMMRQFPQRYPELKRHTKALIPFIA